MGRRAWPGREIGREIREARLGGGISLRTAARVRRDVPRPVRADRARRAAESLGRAALPRVRGRRPAGSSGRAYPDGDPVRDRAQLSLIADRFRARLPGRHPWSAPRCPSRSTAINAPGMLVRRPRAGAGGGRGRDAPAGPPGAPAPDPAEAARRRDDVGRPPGEPTRRRTGACVDLHRRAISGWASRSTGREVLAGARPPRDAGRQRHRR